MTLSLGLSLSLKTTYFCGQFKNCLYHYRYISGCLYVFCTKIFSFLYDFKGTAFIQHSDIFSSLQTFIRKTHIFDRNFLPLVGNSEEAWNSLLLATFIYFTPFIIFNQYCGVGSFKASASMFFKMLS